MRAWLMVVAVGIVGCGSSGGTGGAGGTGGGSAGVGGGGGAGDAPIASCTPGGFTTAPSGVDRLPVPGIASALDQRAYAALLKDGGMGEHTVHLTIEDDFSRDGGAKVPTVSVRFNGCALGTVTDVAGVGKEFSAPGAAVWTPARGGRFVAYEVLDGQGALLYRRAAVLPIELPRIFQVTSPAGPMATVSFDPVPDAGVDHAYLSAYRRIGTGGLQSTGIYSNPPIHTGMVTFPVTNQTNQFQLELQSGPIRLVSVFDTP